MRANQDYSAVIQFLVAMLVWCRTSLTSICQAHPFECMNEKCLTKQENRQQQQQRHTQRVRPARAKTT